MANVIIPKQSATPNKGNHAFILINRAVSGVDSQGTPYGASATSGTPGVDGLAVKYLVHGLNSAGGYRSPSLRTLAQGGLNSITITFDLGGTFLVGAVHFPRSKAFLPWNIKLFNNPPRFGGQVADTGWIHPEYKATLAAYGVGDSDPLVAPYNGHIWPHAAEVPPSKRVSLLRKRQWPLVGYLDKNYACRYVTVSFYIGGFADEDNPHSLATSHVFDNIELRAPIIGEVVDNSKFNVELGTENGFDDLSEIVQSRTGANFGRRAAIVKSRRMRAFSEGDHSSAWRKFNGFFSDEDRGGVLANIAVHEFPSIRAGTIIDNYGIYSVTGISTTSRTPNQQVMSLEIDLKETK